MAVKFLDNTGLGYFWSKIKAWCNATFAVITHNHASNAVNAMTGYSKPNSTSAITTSDTLNQAIGKLEKAVDDADISNVVHKTGDEEISGIKKFPRTILDGSQWCQQQLKVSSELDVSIPSYPPTTRYGGFVFTDKNDAEVGAIYQLFESSGIRRFRIRNFDNSGTGHDYFEIGYNPSTGEEWALCPSTLASRSSNGTDIVTRNWIPQDDRIVHTTGNESINGFKRFGAYSLNIENSDSIAGTAPSADHYSALQFVDKNGNYMAGLQMSNRTTTNYIRLNVIAHNSVSNDSSWYFRANGAFIGPSTPDSPNAQQYLTYDWIPKDTRIVHTTGNEQINGAKEFTSFVNLTGIIFKNSSIDNGAAKYQLMFYSSGNYGLWDIPNSSWVYAISQTYNVVSFNRLVQFGSGWVIKSSGSGCGFVETDYNESVSGSSGWEEFKHYDKNEVLSSKIAFTALGQQSHRILLYTKTKNTTAYELVGFYNENSGRLFWMPGSDNKVELGGGGNRWKVIYSNTGSISTSDKRHKENIQEVPDEVLDTWENINWCQFKFDDAIQEKGIEKARFHVGAVAQDVYDVFANHDLDISKYGIYCYETWEAEAPIYDNETGELRSKGREAGDMYSLRYEEALCMEAAYQRRKNKILENRISELERQVSDMLQILQSLKGAN